jgi:transketolase
MTATALADRPGSPEWVDRHGLSAVDACRLSQLHAAEADERVVSLEGDLGDFGGLDFQRRFPRRFLDVGIAEASLIGTAAGMATAGKVACVNTFASFALMRACEQVRLDVAYHAANVKIFGTFTGLAAGFSGPTHHCIEDLAIARVLPGLTVLAPADAVAAYHLTRAAIERPGPAYLRLGMDATPQVYDASARFVVGRGVLLRDGEDLTIVAAGLTSVASALEAARRLADRGTTARVVDMHTVKPVDADLLLDSAARTGLLVTVEEHSRIGGLGAAVAEVLGDRRPTPLLSLGTPDEFSHAVCDYSEHLRRCGLDAAGIVAAATGALARWK